MTDPTKFKSSLEPPIATAAAASNYRWRRLKVQARCKWRMLQPPPLFVGKHTPAGPRVIVVANDGWPRGTVVQAPNAVENDG
jgi:hypothetical protein